LGTLQRNSGSVIDSKVSESACVRVVLADWLDVARHVGPASVDWVYVDPPFNTGRVWEGKGRCESRLVNGDSGEKLDGAEAIPDGEKSRRDSKGVSMPPASFDDRFGSTRAYLDWLEPRLRATLPMVKPTGSMLIHVDWRTSHRVRVVLDELLGEEHFINHLVWSYGLGGSSPRRFARKHDDLLWYAVDPSRYWFEPPRVPARSQRMRGQMKKATDVLDIPSINNMAAEREDGQGYPTQKPLALLRLLVGACCPPGGLVLDPCCGSGTTLVAAAQLDRRAIGVDVSEKAIQIAKARSLRMPMVGRCP
jgi:site-specific DNA-methyltransferase (adenine-specific)